MKSKLPIAYLYSFLFAFIPYTIVPQAFASEIFTILIAPKNSTAYDSAQDYLEQQNYKDETVLSVERRIHKALNLAHEKLTECDACVVNIKLAAGKYFGKSNSGHWVLPETIAPESVLRILGGYDDRYLSRNPFTTPTELIVNKNRAAPVLQIAGKKHAFRELIISGLTIDVSESNVYSPSNNNIHKTGSSSWPILSLGYVLTDNLIISDNIFMNAVNGVGSPRIQAMSKNAQVMIFNNMFINNIFTWVVAAGGYKNKVDRYILASNSFVLNWPYNPDANTSNPGTVEIGDKHTANSVEFLGNLFAYNVGGAIFPQYDENNSPQLIAQSNMFWKNGTLFGDIEDDSGAVVGKFAGAGTYSTLSSEDIEDDFDWEFEGNESFDPGLIVSSPEFVALSEGVSRGVKNDDKNPNKNSSESEDSLDDLDVLGDELLSMLDDMEEESRVDSEAESSDSFESFVFDSSDQDTAVISGYAPYFPFDVDKLPAPDKARRFGARPDRVKQY